MSSHELLRLTAPTPVAVASDLLGLIKSIEDLLDGSEDEIQKIQNRSWVKQLFAGTRDDLMAISTSQSAVNALMLQLIQEVMLLSSKGYAFLEDTIASLEGQAKTGWRDAEGNFQVLSETGREFAEKAKGIFARFAVSAKSAQLRMDATERQVQAIEKVVWQQDAQIEALLLLPQQVSAARAQQLELAQTLGESLYAMRNQQRDSEQAHAALQKEVACLRADLASAAQASEQATARVRRAHLVTAAAWLALASVLAAHLLQLI
jgi:hypothetical protein